MAILTKGPVGLWPLAAIPLYLLTGPDRWRFRKWLLAMIPTLVVLLALTILMSYPVSAEAISRYVDAQLLATFSGLREAEFGRYEVPAKLLTNLSGPLVYSGVLMLAVGARWTWPNRTVWWLLAVALSASLPLMLSPRQYAHYLVPSLPVYALAITVYCQDAISTLMTRLDTSSRARNVLRVTPLIAGAALMVAVVLKFETVSDDKKEIAFVASVAPLLVRGSEVGTCPGFRNLRLQMVLFRQLNIRLVDDVARPAVLCQVQDPGLGRLVMDGEVRLYHRH